MFKEKLLKRISLLLAITLIICSMSAFVMSENTKADEEETTSTEVSVPDEYEMVCHRGYSGVAPENSKYAFEEAIKANFKHIELDIRRCKENDEGEADWVVTHDETLERLCGVNKKVSEMTVDEIQKYKYKTGTNLSHYNNVKIMSLDELIEMIKDYKEKGQTVDWRIELKELESDDQKDKIYDEVVQPIIDADVLDCVTFISFYSSNLNKILRVNTDLRAWYLAKVLDDEHWGYARSLKTKYKDQVEGVILRGTVYTSDETDVEQAISEGFKVGVYALDSRVMMGAYYSMGIRSFTTNEIAPDSMSISLMKKTYTPKDFKYTLSKRSYTFTNTRKKPTFTVTYEGKELLEGLNYEVSYANNKYPGTGTATVTGVRNFKGEKDKTFTISMPKVKGFSLVKNGVTTLKYQWTPNEYVTGYKVYQYNYSTKKYKLVKTIKKNTTTTFKAKKLLTSKKYRYRVRTYFTYKKKTYKSEACKGKTAYTKPGAEKTISIKRSKKGKSAVVKVGKQKRVTGYVIKISTDKNFCTNVRTVYTKRNSVKFTNLIKKKAYYAKTRAYLKVKSKYYYGKYSKVVKKKGVKPKKKKKKKIN